MPRVVQAFAALLLCSCVVVGEAWAADPPLSRERYAALESMFEHGADNARPGAGAFERNALKRACRRLKRSDPLLAAHRASCLGAIRFAEREPRFTRQVQRCRSGACRAAARRRIAREVERLWVALLRADSTTRDAVRDEGCQAALLTDPEFAGWLIRYALALRNLADAEARRDGAAAKRGRRELAAVAGAIPTEPSPLQVLRRFRIECSAGRS